VGGRSPDSRFFFALKPYGQSGNESLQKRLDSFLDDKAVRHAQVGFSAIDLETREKIIAYNAGKALAPASALKILPTAAMLDTAGGNFRFSTLLLTEGTIDKQSRTLKGNLIIRGGGDPALASSRYDSVYQTPGLFLETWAQKLKTKGVDTISGKLILDATIYGEQSVPDTWNYQDIGNYYGAGAHGLSYNENQYKIVFRAPQKPGQLTTVRYTKPEIPGLEIVNYVKSSEVQADNAYIFGIPESNRIVIRGTIPAGRSAFSIKGAIPRPEVLLQQEFTKILEKQDIVLKNGAEVVKQPYATEEADTLAVQHSPMLRELARETNYESVNLFAEHLGRHLAVLAGKGNTADEMPSNLRRYWRKHTAKQGMQLYDACGLSRYNAITAGQFTDILAYMQDSSSASEMFFQSLPVAGESGTLEYMGRGTALTGNMRGKSGTINNVKAYAGYITTASGRKAAFAFMINNYTGSSSEMRGKIAYLLEGIALLNEGE